MPVSKRTTTGGVESSIGINQSKTTSFKHSSTGGVQRESRQLNTKSNLQQNLIKNSNATALALRARGQKTAPNLLIMRFQKQIKVEGIGEYTIEVTNLVDARTMQVQPIFPSLMNSENTQLASVRQEQLRHNFLGIEGKTVQT